MTALHGPRHHLKQRTIALALVSAGIARSTAWLTLILLYFLGATFVHHLFNDVWFVAILSLYANAATDFGQACASLAQLSAGQAHEDSEHTRHVLTLDMAELNTDLRRLADLQPGVEAHQLARRIGERLKGQS